MLNIKQTNNIRLIPVNTKTKGRWYIYGNARKTGKKLSNLVKDIYGNI